MADLIWSLVALALKTSVIVLLAWLAAALMTRASAAARHTVWAAALAAVLALPAAEQIVPEWRPPVAAGALAGSPVARLVLDVVERREAAAFPLAGALAGLWAAGCLLVLLRTAAAHLQVRAIARRGRPFPLAGPGVLLSREVSVPMVCGLRRPLVLLPEDALEWPAGRLRMVLKHERMHIRRRDMETQLLARLVCALYWPHPLVWWAASRLQSESERACDDGVLSQGEASAAYAGHLLDIVRGLVSGGRVPQGGMAMARISNFERRLTALLKPGLKRGGVSPRFVAVATLAAAALLAPLAVVRAPAQGACTITGTVRDASGAVVPDAQVTAVFAGSHRKELTRTNQVGEFTISPLPEGAYTLTVAKKGFALLRHEGIILPPGQTTRLEFVLNFGRIVESMEIKGEGAPKAADIPSGPYGTPQRIRVGGGVAPPKIAKQVKPVYPPDCKAEGVQGTVLLMAVVSRQGEPLNLKPVNELVDKRLVEAAMEAVRQWRWQPTLLNGQPVEVITEIQLNFTLAQ